VTQTAVRRLSAELSGMLSTDLILREAGAVLARLKGSALSQEVQVDLAGREFLLKANWIGGKIEMRDLQEDRVVARAQKAGLLTLRFVVLPLGRPEGAGDGPEFSIDCKAIGRKYKFLLGDEVVGELRYTGLLGRRLELDVPPGMPLELVVLAIYVSRTLRRQSRGDA
jgi:hypothetical protein